MSAKQFLELAGRRFDARLLLGTAGYPNQQDMMEALEASGAEIVTDLISRGVEWMRIELLEEDAAQTRSHLDLYRGLLDGRVDGEQVWRRLQATNRVGVTRGTLESKRNPLAIL